MTHPAIIVLAFIFLWGFVHFVLEMRYQWQEVGRLLDSGVDDEL